MYCGQTVSRSQKCRDTGSFGSQQALPSFLRVFGDYNEAKGTWSLPTERKSIMNSGTSTKFGHWPTPNHMPCTLTAPSVIANTPVTWIGKALGCALFEPVVSRVGYKWVMVLVIVLQIVGVVSMSVSQSSLYTRHRNRRAILSIR